MTVDESDWIAARFQSHRAHLHAVAYRMLGSASEADDAVQDAWLRLSRADRSGVENLRAWLTTVVARVCLDMLRARKSRREEPLAPDALDGIVNSSGGIDPEREAMLADSVGLALLVVLDTLGPAERLAFVLHDIFGIRSTRLLHWWAARRLQPRSSPAVPGTESTALARCRAGIWRASGASSRRFSRRYAAATSLVFSQSSIPTLCAEPTATPCGRVLPQKCGARRLSRNRRSPMRRGADTHRSRSSTARRASSSGGAAA